METTLKEVNTQNNKSVQDYLSLGYLFLLALGIIRDAVYYGFLGINILSYSSLTDVLLSPIIYFTRDIKTTLAIFFMIGAIFFLNHSINKNAKKKSTKGQLDSSESTIPPKINVGKNHSMDRLLFLICLMLTGFYLGSGLGGGIKHSKKIEEGKFEMEHQLYFSNNDIIDVKIIGQNSQYMFYLAENSKTITVAPIQGNIVKIEELPEKAKKSESEKIQPIQDEDN